MSIAAALLALDRIFRKLLLLLSEEGEFGIYEMCLPLDCPSLSLEVCTESPESYEILFILIAMVRCLNSGVVIGR